MSATLDRPLVSDDAVVLTVDERPRRRRLGPGPRRRFAGALGPLLRPLFTANHLWAMRRGEESLALEVARRRAGSEAERAAVPPPPAPTWPA